LTHLVQVHIIFGEFAGITRVWRVHAVHAQAVTIQRADSPQGQSTWFIVSIWSHK